MLDSATTLDTSWWVNELEYWQLNGKQAPVLNQDIKQGRFALHYFISFVTCYSTPPMTLFQV